MLYDSNLTSDMVFLQRHRIEHYRILSVVNCRVAINFTFNDQVSFLSHGPLVLTFILLS